MRKAGKVSVYIYLLYIIVGIVFIALGLYEVNYAPPKEFPDMVMTHFVGGVILIIGIAAMVIKSLHFSLGLGLFSFICALADAFGVLVIWWLFVLENDTLTEMLPFIIISLFPAVACISNLLSMKRN